MSDPVNACPECRGTRPHHYVRPDASRLERALEARSRVVALVPDTRFAGVAIQQAITENA